MNKEILNTLEDLSKKPTTELAMRLMETIADNMAKDKELERYKSIADEIINKFENFIETTEYEKICHSDLKELLNEIKELRGSDE